MSNEHGIRNQRLSYHREGLEGQSNRHHQLAIPGRRCCVLGASDGKLYGSNDRLTQCATCRTEID